MLPWAGRLLARPVLKMRAGRKPRWLTVLVYHRVLPRPGPEFALDTEVVDCDPRRFDRDMALIASTCTPIDLGLLVDFLDGRAELPPNPVLVTFDDGYIDNREHALPILLRHGIRAVFFVSSAYVTRRRAFWWDRIAYLVRHARADVARLGYPTDLVLRVGEDRDLVTSTALRIVKTRRGLDVDRFLDEMGHALGVPWDDALERRLADEHIMSWDDVRALHAAGMDIGSHTDTHRVLDTLEPAQLTAELVASRADIERAIGAGVSSIAYPVGRPIRSLPLIERAVRDACYEVGFSVERRANALARSAFDRFNVTRVPVVPSMSYDRLAALLAAPELSGARQS